MIRISELKALTRRKLNIRAKGLGLKPIGSKPELIEKIYEIETSTGNRRIDQMFKKIPNPKYEITNIHENTSDLTHDNKMKKKRMRDEDDNMVSSKHPKITDPPSTHPR